MQSSTALAIIDNLFTYGPLVKLLHESKAYNTSAMEMERNSIAKRRKAIRLSEYESAKMNKLLHAMNVFVEEHQLPVLRTTANIYDGFVSAEFNIKVITQFCGRLASFNSLTGADQLAILKRFCLDLFFIRGSFQFDLERKGFAVVLVGSNICRL